MSRFVKVLKHVLACAIILGVAFFFWRAFDRNWASISAHPFRLDYPFLGLSLLAVAATYLLATYAWHITINTISKDAQVTFSQSVATVNASGLTKYLPGRIWSYALQMYWLTRLGFSKSLVLYVNLINIFISILTTFMLGAAYLLLSPERFPLSTTAWALGALLVVDVLCIRFNSTLFNVGITLVGRVFKREVAYFEVPKGLMVRLHALHGLASFCFGIGAYFLCFGLGYRIELAQAPLVMSSLLLSDTVAFLAFLVPGGLGVREGLMYMLLGGVSSGSLALVLPLAARILSMLVDVLLGGIALKLLRNFLSEPRPDQGAPSA